jgi:hypothetical protein
MKKLLVILVITILTSCSKELPIQISNIESVVIKDTQKVVIKDTQKVNELLLTIDFDSLAQKGYMVGASPMVVDFDNNGKYDIIVNRWVSSRTATTYSYELKDPFVILDNKTILELTGFWKGGTTSGVGDFNGDGFNDIVVMDNGPEYWDLNPNPIKIPLTVYWNVKGKFDGSNTIVTPMHNGCFSINIFRNKDGFDEIIPMQNPNEDFRYRFNGKTFDEIEIKNVPNISHTSSLYSDYDNNGTMDVFVFQYSAGAPIQNAKPALILNVFENPIVKYFDIPKEKRFTIGVTADFKKNGLKDIILIARVLSGDGPPIDKKHYLYYLENMGNGEFVFNTKKLPETITPYTNVYPMFYVADDINKDGYIDFYNINSHMNLYFLNNKGDFKNGL